MGAEMEDPASKFQTNGDGKTVVTSDPNAAQQRKTGGALVKDKKIPDDQRTTTPYMTKYERARVLGTRALQIRYMRKVDMHVNVCLS